jgi:hypothetical protein
MLPSPETRERFKRTFAIAGCGKSERIRPDHADDVSLCHNNAFPNKAFVV